MQKYFTLVAKKESAYKVSAMVLNFPVMIPSPEPRLCGGGKSRRSHIQGTNRNRIALHVMLSGRRNWARWW